MRHYIALVHQEEDSAFGVQFPDLPGCFSASDDAEGLLPNAQEALALYLEDETDWPTPRTVEAIRSDAEVRSALAEGAFLLAVPLIHLSGRTAKANVTMDSGLLAAIDATAKARGMTRSAFLADVARREIAAKTSQ